MVISRNTDIEQYLAVAGNGNGGVQFMAAPASSAQLLRGLRAAGRLAEQPVSQRQRLIGADDKRAGLIDDTQSAFSRASRPRSRRAPKAGILLHARSSISAGMASKEMPALASSICRARLCEARINGSFPRQMVIRPSFRKPLPLPVGKQLQTAAAVSSIERRVTSSCAQLNLALSRRANATSSATA
jgi:hypothetical protein